MPDAYHAFLIRYWQRAGGAQRVVIQHIASGERAVVTGLPAALAWIEARCASEAGRRVAPLTAPDEPPAQPGEE